MQGDKSTGGATADGTADLDNEATRLSDVLTGIASDETRERIAIGDLLAAMQERAFGPLMLVFALPNVLPTPPGTSTILGAPLIFLTAQLALGRNPWLPPLISRRSIARRDFAAFVGKAVPWLAKAENLLRPRFGALAHPPAEYVVGIMCLVLAVVLVLPIPLGNMLPALAICILALGILERDGIWVLAGMTVAFASLGVVSGVVWGFVTAGLYLLKSFLG
ncbi:exopolysaccharide biosynthesis protein [Ancylobacter defluvii]|uniref:ABC transporter permease n=1 Tax=Ancylobacter defluvii TaxID=1282440 RepID=A0A9W6JZP9_9HYPH|nr:exopolysaccharide biosynthesis protein [Ancylobacter defluvii]MBS7589695.1 exopolysaccharide biosynthesis protein [Ancylobacter defluvii]GLK85319.1 ABC transporter permease [Ancylobacter defluvii]